MPVNFTNTYKQISFSAIQFHVQYWNFNLPSLQVMSNLYTMCYLLYVKKQNQLVLAINVGEIDRFGVYLKNQ